MWHKEAIIMSCSCFRPSSVGKKSSAHDDIVSDLLESTKNFHSSNKIGQGGSGIVSKGTLRSGRRIAVKKLSAESKQGVREFLAKKIHGHCDIKTSWLLLLTK